MKWLVYEWRQLRSFLLAYGGVWIILFVIALFFSCSRSIEAITQTVRMPL